MNLMLGFDVIYMKQSIRLHNRLLLNLERAGCIFIHHVLSR